MISLLAEKTGRSNFHGAGSETFMAMNAVSPESGSLSGETAG
jgi:hypothetical protein